MVQSFHCFKLLGENIMSFGVIKNSWDANCVVNCLIGAAGGALSTIAPEAFSGTATSVPVIGGLLVGATFLTVFQLSGHFLSECGMDPGKMESRWARAAVFLSRLALALLAAGGASFIVGTLAGYTLTAWAIIEVGCAPILVKFLVVDPLIRAMDNAPLAAP
jgi:hypothetical protein